MPDLWIAAIGCAVVLGLGVAIWFYTRKPSLGLNDRYSTESLISSEQQIMLGYLQSTFPELLVVPNVPLSRMLRVRRADQPKQAEDRLKNHMVDFVVCKQDGKPIFAFDMEQFHLSDARNKALQAKIKKRMLKTAGVRLVLVKASVERMPPPDEFREQLNLVARAQAQFNRRASDRKSGSERSKVQSLLSESDPTFASSIFKESEVLDASGLAELDEMLNRPGSRQVRLDTSEFDSVQWGRSGFDGSTNDVRGR